MLTNNHDKSYILQYPNYLWFLIVSFSMTLAMSNWYDSRIVEIFGISVTPGSLVYSITFLLSNTITEVYGFKNSRKTILTALLFNVIFIIYGWIVMHLPTPASATYDSSFDSFLIVNSRIITASFLSYLISEPINACIVSKLKVVTSGRYMGVRFVSSTVVSGLIDSILFILIAFYGTMTTTNLISLITHIWLVKTVIEIAGLPLSIRMAKKLKKAEQLDIYDTNTHYTLFSLNADYKESENKYNK